MTPRRPPEYDPTRVLTLPYVPNGELQRTLTDHGMPAKDASSAVLNTGLRLFATSFYFDVIEANKGDKEARERVDYCRHIWNEQAKREKENKAHSGIVVPRGI